MAEFNLKEVPPWGWGIAVVVGYFIYTKSKSSTPATATTATPTVGTGSYTEYVPVDQTTTSTQPVYSTNQQWATAAINWLIGQGYSPALANSAIAKAIAGGVDATGNGMSASEYSLWSLALQQFGSPPQPVSVSPPSQAPGPVNGGYPPVIGAPIPGRPAPGLPAPTPPPVKAPVRYYVVKPWPLQGSSLWSIAQLYYGDGNKWPEIYNANRTGITRADGSPGVISNASFVYPGEKLVIP